MAENHYIPDEVTPPGETLLEVLEERGITQEELAEKTGYPRIMIDEIVTGRAAITSEMALQLEHILKVPAPFWTNRERHYREFLARCREQTRLARA